MNYIIFVPIFAIIDWFAVEYKWKFIEYFAKPATMIFLILWLVQQGGFSGWMIWFVFGALFSLVGDIFLMLPYNLFLGGLISFLLAHIAYIIGLNETLPPIRVPGLTVFIVITIIAWQTFSRLAAGLDSKGLSRLKIPVLVYTMIISLMTLSAINTLQRADWSFNSAVLVSVGGILFIVSDFILAWDRFVSSISHIRLKTMITYHLSQVGILIGAAIHYLI